MDACVVYDCCLRALDLEVGCWHYVLSGGCCGLGGDGLWYLVVCLVLGV